MLTYYYSDPHSPETFSYVFNLSLDIFSPYLRVFSCISLLHLG